MYASCSRLVHDIMFCTSMHASGPSGPGSYQAATGCLQAVLAWLAEQPAVYWLAPAPKLRTANFYATGIAQNVAPGTADLTTGTCSPYSNTHSFGAAGLQVPV